jgi:hypothetical protein
MVSHGTQQARENPMKSTEAERRLAHEQALASARLSGHEPTPEFLADCEAVIKGTMTQEQAQAASLARALAADRAARGLPTTAPEHPPEPATD